MYVGNLLIVAGLAVATNSLTCLLVVIPLYLFVYIAIVAAEEAFLRNKFGAAYDQYAADVPRWLPRLAALGEALRDGRFHWKRVLVKEFHTPFGWMTVLMLMSFWHLASQHTLATRPGIARALIVGYVVLAAVYLTIRYSSCRAASSRTRKPAPFIRRAAGTRASASRLRASKAMQTLRRKGVPSAVTRRPSSRNSISPSCCSSASCAAACRNPSDCRSCGDHRVARKVTMFEICRRSSRSSASSTWPRWIGSSPRSIRASERIRFFSVWANAVPASPMAELPRPLSGWSSRNSL
jgi:protein-S-isoprenylcysteine O-methyltransferase Ste14